MNATLLSNAGSSSPVLAPRTIQPPRFNPFAGPATDPASLPAPAKTPTSAPQSPIASEVPAPSQHSALSTQHSASPRDFSATASLAHSLYHAALARIAAEDARGLPPSDSALRRLDLLRRQYVSAASIDLRHRALAARLARTTRPSSSPPAPTSPTPPEVPAPPQHSDPASSRDSRLATRDFPSSRDSRLATRDFPTPQHSGLSTSPAPPLRLTPSAALRFP